MSNKHTCHWPGCKIRIPVHSPICDYHWNILPKHIRDLMFRHYKSSNYRAKPNTEYLEAYNLARDWALRYELSKKEQENILDEIDGLIEEIG
jgi:hypothetical protein